MSEGENVTIEKGDCVASVAADHGLFWRTVWDHPENAELKELRQDPNVLRAGDSLFVPDKRTRGESIQTGAKHSFKRKGVPSRVRIRFLALGEPRAHLRFEVNADGVFDNGETDADGWAEFPVPPGVKDCVLVLGEGTEAEEFDLELGGLDPLEEVRGVQQRLANMGYPTAIDGLVGDEMTAAIKTFQRDKGLEETGEIDEATRDALRDGHGGS